MKIHRFAIILYVAHKIMDLRNTYDSRYSTSGIPANSYRLSIEAFLE